MTPFYWSVYWIKSGQICPLDEREGFLLPGRFHLFSSWKRYVGVEKSNNFRKIGSIFPPCTEEPNKKKVMCPRVGLTNTNIHFSPNIVCLPEWHHVEIWCYRFNRIFDLHSRVIYCYVRKKYKFFFGGRRPGEMVTATEFWKR